MTVALPRPWLSEDKSGTRLYMWCPGCDDLHGIEVEGPSRWEWNGNLESPTVSPSILVNRVQWSTEYSFHRPTHNVEPGSKTTCHSFVRQGQWEFLGDCTHNLAGQTVPMGPLPDWFVNEGEQE